MLPRQITADEARELPRVNDGLAVADAPLADVQARLRELEQELAEQRRLNETLRQSEGLLKREVGLLRPLQERDRRKDEFLAMLAHELRNPLAPLRNTVHILRACGTTLPDVQWARDVIDRQVQQMTRLVDDLLDVSRIATGKIELRKERTLLASVVSVAVDASRPLIDNWGHSLTVTLPAEPVTLDADPTRLAQVLQNLLNNAAKYTNQGGHITLTALCDADSRRVVIRVTDDGIGISAEQLPHVFEMFSQGDHSLERPQGGLGIGLTLVHRLVEMHGGTVEAESAGVGQGSEFTVRLPVSVEAADPARRSDTPAYGMALESSRRILVVDDDRDAADSLGMLLRRMGHDVRTAHDGVEALGATAVFEPNVVLLDIGLPKLNGYDAARRIRQQCGSDVILIAVTGWGQDEDRRRSTEAGFDHHLTKPIEPSALTKLLTVSLPSG